MFNKAKQEVQQFIPGTAEHALFLARRQAALGSKVVLICDVVEDYGKQGDYEHKDYRYELRVKGHVIEGTENESVKKGRRFSGKQSLGKVKNVNEFIFTGLDDGTSGLQQRFGQAHLRLKRLRQSLPVGSLEYTINAVSRYQGELVSSATSFGLSAGDEM